MSDIDQQYAREVDRIRAARTRQAAAEARRSAVEEQAPGSDLEVRSSYIPNGQSRFGIGVTQVRADLNEQEA